MIQVSETIECSELIVLEVCHTISSSANMKINFIELLNCPSLAQLNLINVEMTLTSLMKYLMNVLSLKALFLLEAFLVVMIL